MDMPTDKKFNATLNKKIIGEVLFLLHERVDVLDLLKSLAKIDIAYLQENIYYSINGWIEETLQNYCLLEELTDIIVNNVIDMFKQHSTIEKVVETKEVIKFTL